MKDGMSVYFVYEWMSQWMNYWMTEMDELMNGWTNGRMDHWFNGWKDARMNGWMKEWCASIIYLCCFASRRKGDDVVGAQQQHKRGGATTVKHTVAALYGTTITASGIVLAKRGAYGLATNRRLPLRVVVCWGSEFNKIVNIFVTIYSTVLPVCVLALNTPPVAYLQGCRIIVLLCYILHCKPSSPRRKGIQSTFIRTCTPIHHPREKR